MTNSNFDPDTQTTDVLYQPSAADSASGAHGIAEMDDAYSTDIEATQSGVITVLGRLKDRAWYADWQVGPGQRAIGTDGSRLQCTVAGTTGSSEPTWPTSIGGTVTDGTVTWQSIWAPAGVATTNNTILTGDTQVAQMVADFLTLQDKTTASNVALRLAQADNQVYVSKSGIASDSNDGLSAGTAKATIAGALTALGSNPGTVKLLYGSWTLSAADSNGNGVTIGQIGQILDGVGQEMTVINVTAATTWAVKAQASYAKVRNLTVNISAAATYGVGCTVPTPGSGSVEQCVFENVHVAVESGTTVTACFAQGPDTSVDVSVASWQGCRATNNGTCTYGFLFGNGTGGNVLIPTVRDSYVYGTEYGVALAGCGVTWTGGGMTNISGACIYVIHSGTPAVFIGLRTENSAQFVATAGNIGSVSGGITFMNCEADAFTGISDNGTVIQWNASGGLTLIGCRFTTTGANTNFALGQVPGQIIAFTAIDVTTDVANPFPAQNLTYYQRVIINHKYISSGLVVPSSFVLTVDNAPTSGDLQPSANGFAGWTFDPMFTAGTQPTLAAAGILYLAKLVLPQASAVSNIIARVNAAASGATAGECFAAIYSSTGTLLGQTADQSTAWGTIGLKTMVLTVPTAVLAAGTVLYVAFLFNGTTPPTFNGLQTGNPSFGAPTSSPRCGTTGSGLTALPASITLTGVSQGVALVWAGVS